MISQACRVHDWLTPLLFSLYIQPNSYTKLAATACHFQDADVDSAGLDYLKNMSVSRQREDYKQR